jgi:hypothetical protein
MSVYNLVDKQVPIADTIAILKKHEDTTSPVAIVWASTAIYVNVDNIQKAVSAAELADYSYYLLLHSEHTEINREIKAKLDNLEIQYLHITTLSNIGTDNWNTAIYSTWQFPSRITFRQAGINFWISLDGETIFHAGFDYSERPINKVSLQTKIWKVDIPAMRIHFISDMLLDIIGTTREKSTFINRYEIVPFIIWLMKKFPKPVVKSANSVNLTN